MHTTNSKFQIVYTISAKCNNIFRIEAKLLDSFEEAYLYFLQI